MLSKIAIRFLSLAILFGIILVISVILHGLTKKCFKWSQKGQTSKMIPFNF
jgi:hypothetical protein